ncbi:MAG TPA: copper resistance protein NlpE N-terminal domain-containing protein [Edaphobacter sp.]|nr:copper resistance protein NlpE N-terminal domain-containing protein [Edaphobacter sp.]
MRVAVYGALLAAWSCVAVTVRAKTVTLEDADNYTRVSLNLGDTLVVHLPSTLPGQYEWVSHLDKKGPLSAQGDTLISSTGKDAKKGEGIREFRYNAARVGEATLKLVFEARNKGAPTSTSSQFLPHIAVASGAPSAAQAVLVGVYRGTLPCADCSGLDTELRLYAKGKFDTTYAFYVETRTYRGAREGDVAYSERGEWTVLKGSASDPNATVYQLNPDNPAETQSYLRVDNGAALRQLDRELKPIASTMNLTLRRAQ